MDSPGQLAFMDSLRFGYEPSRPSRAFASTSAVSANTSFASSRTTGRRASSTGPGSRRRRPGPLAASMSGGGGAGAGAAAAGAVGGGAGKRKPKPASSAVGVTLASAIERASQALPDTQRSQLKFLAEKISQVVTRLQAEETRRKAAEAQVEELRRELRHWRQHASSIRDKYVVAAKESGVNPQTLEDTLQREEALKAEKAGWEQVKAQQASAISQLTRMNDMLMEKLDTAKREAAATAEGHAAAARGLDEQLAAAQRRIATLEDELSEGNQERTRTMADAAARHDELRSDGSRLRKRMEEAEAKALKADSARRQAQEAATVQQTELRRTIRRLAASDKKVETLTKELDAAADDNESLRQRLDAVRRRSEQLHAEVNRLNRALDEKERRLDEALNATKAIRLQLEKKASAAEARVAKAKEEAQLAVDKLKQANARMEELAAENASLVQLDRSRKAQVERSDSLASKLKAEVEESARLRDEVDTVTTALVDVRQSRAEAEAKLHVVQQELKSVTARLEVQTREATEVSQLQHSQQLKHEREVLQMETQLDNLRDQKEELEGAMRMLQLSQDDTLRELSTVGADRDALRATIKDLEDRVVALQEESTRVSLESLRRSTQGSLRGSPGRSPLPHRQAAAARAAVGMSSSSAVGPGNVWPPSTPAAAVPLPVPTPASGSDAQPLAMPPPPPPSLPTSPAAAPAVQSPRAAAAATAPNDGADGEASPAAPPRAAASSPTAAAATAASSTGAVSPSAARRNQELSSMQVGSAEDIAARWSIVYALTGDGDAATAANPQASAAGAASDSDADELAESNAFAGIANGDDVDVMEEQPGLRSRAASTEYADSFEDDDST